MTTKTAVPFLVAMMLLTGVCNTLLTKYQVCFRTVLLLRAPQAYTCVSRTFNVFVTVIPVISRSGNTLNNQLFKRESTLLVVG